jgi:large subunit ribosomal protein L25
VESISLGGNMERVELKAKVRESKGKNAAYRQRVNEEIPAILYGKKEEGLSLTLNAKEVLKTLRTDRGRNVMLNLKIDGKADAIVMFKEIQKHPVTEKIIHVDLYKINMQEEIIVLVKTKISGEAPGVKLGGVLEQPLRQLRLKALPDRIPDAVIVDVSGLNINDSIHVEDLKLGEGIKALDNKRDVVATVSVVKEEVEPVPGEVAPDAPTGPEVIGEKEREEKRLATEKEKEEKGKEKSEAKEEAKKDAKK